MWKFVSHAFCSIALLGILSLVAPTSALAAEHGTNHARQTRNPSIPKSTIHVERRTSARPPKNHSQNGQLSYSAYWKAANSPNPPKTSNNPNIYAQKLQAWKDYQDRTKK